MKNFLKFNLRTWPRLAVMIVAVALLLFSATSAEAQGLQATIYDGAPLYSSPDLNTYTQSKLGDKYEGPVEKVVNEWGVWYGFNAQGSTWWVPQQTQDGIWVEEITQPVVAPTTAPIEPPAPPAGEQRRTEAYALPFTKAGGCEISNFACRMSVNEQGKKAAPLTVTIMVLLGIMPYFWSGMERRREAKARLMVFWVAIGMIWILIAFFFMLVTNISADARWGWIPGIINMFRVAFSKPIWIPDLVQIDNTLRAVIFAGLAVGIPIVLWFLWKQSDRDWQPDTSKEEQTPKVGSNQYFPSEAAAKAWTETDAVKGNIKVLEITETEAGNGRWVVRYNPMQEYARRDKSLVSCVALTVWFAEQLFFGRPFQLDIGDAILLIPITIQGWELFEECARHLGWMIKLAVTSAFWSLVLIAAIKYEAVAMPFLLLLQPLSLIAFPVGVYIVDEKDSISTMNFDWLNQATIITLALMQVVPGWK